MRKVAAFEVSRMAFFASSKRSENLKILLARTSTFCENVTKSEARKSSVMSSVSSSDEREIKPRWSIKNFQLFVMPSDIVNVYRCL